MILIVFAIKIDKGGSHSEVDDFQDKVDGLIGFQGKYPCEIAHNFSDFCKFDGWVHID